MRLPVHHDHDELQQSQLRGSVVELPSDRGSRRRLFGSRATVSDAHELVRT